MAETGDWRQNEFALLFIHQLSTMAESQSTDVGKSHAQLVAGSAPATSAGAPKTAGIVRYFISRFLNLLTACRRSIC